MVAIAPFRALRFDAGRIDLATATCPPHDCISTAQRDAFIAADAHNIAGVVLPPDAPGDAEAPATPNKFQRAAALLDSWQKDESLARDARPAFFLYAITSGPPEARHTMHALFARVRLDPTYTEIRRHEKTLKRKKQERLHLRGATNTDTEPIWLLYRDERGWVEEILRSNAFDEVARLTDEEGHEHRVWRIDRPEAVAEVTAQFDDRGLVIADGHHRYQTALDHHAATGRPEHGSILACLVRDNDPGVRIEATHRLVHGLSFAFPEALRLAQSAWDATPLALAAGPAETQARTLAAALGAPGTQQCILLGQSPTGRLEAHVLRPRGGPVPAGPRGRLDTLAVTLLHERLLAACWGLDLEHPEEHLRFTRSTLEAVQAVASGACQFAVLPAPEPVSAVLEVAQQGHVMPQKATYFVPKLRSGLVLGPLDEAPPVPWTEQAGDPSKFKWRMPGLD
ncbi:MAG: DUF1015 domain-containing protein [Candidatus Thermoplasmatota archaeon]